FYRVDTALVVPELSTGGYRLRLHGLVQRPVTWTYQDLLRMPLVEQTLTLVCVSDPVGGPYVGNARWLGVPLGPLLRAAGVDPRADQLFMTASDGMTIGADLRAAMDGRPALLAVGMNGEPLPFEHGFPVRAVIPGFYGYASACKWLVDLEVTTYRAREAYWVPRGYAARGPIKLESRIDTPASFAQLKRGPVTVAGSAWLPGVGIRAVQVSVDRGPWQDAALASADSVDTWRQWRWTWHAPAGTHSLYARAVDARGRVQTSASTGVLPNGATGRQSVVVTVT
ncbi:MAG: molybdopterin-dependent oxidoreductase, partial [Acidimicrobiales bacterium]